MTESWVCYLTWQEEILPHPCSSSIPLEYLLSAHPFICAITEPLLSARFAWRCAALGCTIKVGIKARNNYSGLCGA